MIITDSLVLGKAWLLHPPKYHALSSLDPDRKYFLSPSTSKGTARSCSLCLADWRARQARVFKVLPKVPPQELDSTHGEVLEDVIHVKHNEHGDTKYPNLAILKYLDFKVKSLMLAGEKATDNDAAPLGKKNCKVWDETHKIIEENIKKYL